MPHFSPKRGGRSRHTPPLKERPGEGRQMERNDKGENENQESGCGTSERQEAELGGGCPGSRKERRDTRPPVRN